MQFRKVVVDISIIVIVKINIFHKEIESFNTAEQVNLFSISSLFD